MAVKIDLPGLDPAEVLFQAAVGLRLNPDPAASTIELWQTLNDRIAEYHYQQIETVFLFDDADQAEKERADANQPARSIPLRCASARLL